MHVLRRRDWPYANCSCLGQGPDAHHARPPELQPPGPDRTALPAASQRGGVNAPSLLCVFQPGTPAFAAESWRWGHGLDRQASAHVHLDHSHLDP